jgi:hypothetical protein
MAAKLAGLLALAELGWAGYSLIQVAPTEKFLGTDPIGLTIARLGNSGSGRVPVRIKARDSFYGDLRAVAAGLEKTNINDVFQLDQPARLYETLYRSTSLPRPRDTNLLMSEPAAEFDRRVRQAVFNRMSVNYLVSDRCEPDPGWPAVGSGYFDGRPFVVQRNPTVLPRGYVVPRATVVNESPPVMLSLFCRLDARQTVIMDHDPLAGLDPVHRQPFTPVDWLSHDPDHPVLRVTTNGPGLLVVADSWMPGWTATIDGRAVPVLQGNLAQRVIPIFQPGSHTIALHYHAPGLAVGEGITCCSLVVWFALVGASFREWRVADGFHPPFRWLIFAAKWQKVAGFCRGLLPLCRAKRGSGANRGGPTWTSELSHNLFACWTLRLFGILQVNTG